MAVNTNSIIKIPFNEKTMQFATYRFNLKKQHPICIPNIMTSYRLREADIFAITRAGFAHEFEIKCTTGDFRVDFINKKSKHSDLSMKYVGNADEPAITNYYWFVAKANIIPMSEIPKYAGYLEVEKIGIYFSSFHNSVWIYAATKIVKNAPLLHRSKFDVGGDLARKLTNKYWDLNEKYLIQRYSESKNEL